ncbi:IS982 family transposase, partial [Streptomyces sp. NPDC091279]
MKTDLDALLTALYVFIDDHVAPCRRIGRPPKLTDAELLCLAVAQVLLGFPSARHWMRFAHARLGHLFPYLPQQSAYNKRLNTAGPLISQVTEALARQVPTWHDSLRLIDSTPLP